MATETPTETTATTNGFTLPAEFGEYTVVTMGTVGRSYENKLDNFVGQIVGIYDLPNPVLKGTRKKKNTEEMVNSYIFRFKLVHGQGELAEVQVPEAMYKRFNNLMKAKVNSGTPKPIIQVRVVRDNDKSPVVLEDPINPRKRTKRAKKNTSSTATPALPVPNANPSPAANTTATGNAPTTPSRRVSRPRVAAR